MIKVSFVASSMLFALFSASASAQDLCADAALVERVDGERRLFNFREAEAVIFETTAACNAREACAYDIYALDLQMKRTIMDGLTIPNICSAFKRTERTSPNRYFESVDSLTSGFEKETKLTYLLSEGSPSVSVHITSYHNGKSETQWGMWHSDTSGGGILGLGASVVEVYTSF